MKGIQLVRLLCQAPPESMKTSDLLPAAEPVALPTSAHGPKEPSAGAVHMPLVLCSVSCSMTSFTRPIVCFGYVQLVYSRLIPSTRCTRAQGKTSCGAIAQLVHFAEPRTERVIIRSEDPRYTSPIAIKLFIQPLENYGHLAGRSVTARAGNRWRFRLHGFVLPHV